ncbi:hypothetical protein M1N66_03300 [Thermodesulfovibrionales bacterium]|nr:hypothetical protein [Thermodesulfovibrionales bacterium]MCL0096615.1 hypothetical protein [Thermodesulfovibrionales bacterium]
MESMFMSFIGRQWHKIQWWLILPVLITGILIGIVGHRGEQRQYQPMISEAEVRFGDVIVDPAAREIRFSGQVRQNESWVRFIVYLTSYRWLEEEAAIISPANLIDLQKAIALFDWQLWDQLWFREITGQKIEVYLTWPGGGKVEANELIRLPYHLGIGDLVFLGSPFFDPLFLAYCAQTMVCIALKHRYRCPLFFLQESVKEKFTRPCGTAGYQLDGIRLPPPGTEVTVIIRVPGLT